MVHLILTGATGLVGSAVLSHILSLPASATPQITRLSILTRNPNIALLASPPPLGTPSTNKHTKIEVIEHGHKDFDFDFGFGSGTFGSEVLEEKLRGADACIWCLGVSQNDVDPETYVRVTRDFAVNAARAFSTLSLKPASSSVGQDSHNYNHNDATATATATGQGKKGEGEGEGEGKFKFIYVSGEGATQTPSRFTPLYGRVKGETETALLDLMATTSRRPEMRDKLSVYCVRPAAVDGTNQPWLWKEVLQNHRTGFQRFYLRLLMPPIRYLGRASWLSPTEELGRVLVEMALRDDESGGGGTTTSMQSRGMRSGEDGEEGEEGQEHMKGGGRYETYGPDGLSGVGGRILDNVVLRRLGREALGEREGR
ncbi:hypothetical protein LTR99_002426 [Exophiala xenobiotica]|uniref:NAD(P)-binding domain-containing protein n=1 Tax=Vermiconidia calcicola TaxID=1690605 RepID=A0AAV9QIC0_9PEZI|nr:hypothetical protein LTR96_002665 [Exophiala xenobiotica]KAK5541501.1 hypothetical protein LTR23_005823 [Chaetothyriales sp. CCFEE 6169]KAK5542237.1 hypothetical protein LTR25_002122 [Vermiconidia calcicola]KAK5306734.1 hypothetical protein LTR99_002426 [Exophiala xenobiotica]KAK5341287.1 hypothetical protein LTR98_002079 [Exophiala xenobiotica]